MFAVVDASLGRRDPHLGGGSDGRADGQGSVACCWCAPFQGL
jgi:hypothetical protein